EQFRSQIQYRADQQSPGTATTNRESTWFGVAIAYQFLGTGNEIAEGVRLVLQLSGAVPGFAKIATASNVGNGEHESAIQQRQACMREPRIETVAVRAVTVEIQRRWFAEKLAATDQADRYLGTVGGRRPDAAAFVGIGIERAFD